MFADVLIEILATFNADGLTDLGKGEGLSIVVEKVQFLVRVPNRQYNPIKGCGTPGR